MCKTDVKIGLGIAVLVALCGVFLWMWKGPHLKVWFAMTTMGLVSTKSIPVTVFEIPESGPNLTEFSVGGLWFGLPVRHVTEVSVRNKGQEGEMLVVRHPKLDIVLAPPIRHDNRQHLAHGHRRYPSADVPQDEVSLRCAVLQLSRSDFSFWSSRRALLRFAELAQLRFKMYWPGDPRVTSVEVLRSPTLKGMVRELRGFDAFDFVYFSQDELTESVATFMPKSPDARRLARRIVASFRLVGEDVSGEGHEGSGPSQTAKTIRRAMRDPSTRPTTAPVGSPTSQRASGAQRASWHTIPSSEARRANLE